MTPRLKFSNPHALPDSTKIISRSELYRIEGEETETRFTKDPIAIARLNELLSKRILPPTLSTSAHKKRKITEFEDTHEFSAEAPILFRLVSSVLPPFPVSLLPPPPPPPITREPGAEDNEIEALLRKQRAELVSIDAELILRESSHSPSTSRLKVVRMHSTLEEPAPNIMIIRTLQSPRKTRPPVLSSIKTYPYTSDISSLGVEFAQSEFGNLYTIDAQQEDPSAKRPPKSRRRKKADCLKERPPPQFWRPSSTLTGKCRGYAYGYPSYLASATGSLRKRYARDSMKTGILVDNT